MNDRGSYRAIKTVLLDGPDYQQLSERARHVFLALKLSFGPSGLEVHYPGALEAVLSARTAIPADAVAGALDELESGGWIRRERNVVWIIGQLEHEPSLNIRLKNHRKSIAKHVAGMPHLQIVAEFARKYQSWLEDTDGIGDTITNGIPNAPAITEDRRPNTEDRVLTTTEDKSSEAGASRNDNLGDVLAPVIRENMWLGKEPPPKTLEREPGWNMGRELTVAQQLISSGDVSAADLVRIIEVHREALEVDEGRPTSLLWFNRKDRRDLLNICRGYLDQHAGQATSVGEVLRQLQVSP